MMTGFSSTGTVNGLLSFSFTLSFSFSGEYLSGSMVTISGVMRVGFSMLSVHFSPGLAEVTATVVVVATLVVVVTSVGVVVVLSVTVVVP